MNHEEPKDHEEVHRIILIKQRIEDLICLDKPPTDDEIHEHGYAKIAAIRWREQIEKEQRRMARLVAAVVVGAVVVLISKVLLFII